MPANDIKDRIPSVTPEILRRLAGTRSFERGEDYYEDKTVRSLRRSDNGVRAMVQGTHRYRVRLWNDDGGLGYDCTCPVGWDGDFCKHCVAVGLAWHAGGECGGDGSSGFTEGDMRSYLQRLDKEELVSMLLDQAEEDDRLHRRLMVRAAQTTEGTADISVWKQALDDALEVDDFVSYREAHDYANDVEDVIDSLEDLLRDGQAEKVIDMAEYGLEEVERGLEHTDDSNGWMGGQLARLQELHLEACRMAPPDPEDLAERLFEWEIETPYDTFYQAVFVYADILGETGRAVYRRLAEAEWAKMPALAPGDEDTHRYGGRYRITSIMEALARESGDFDALIAIKSRDLSKSGNYLGIAQLYQDAGDSDRALDWAERGWRAFPGAKQDDRLRTFIADAYQKQGRHDEAMALIWDAFADRPWLETYKNLERHGRHAKQWPGWRDKALALIRERIAEAKAEPPDLPWWMQVSSRGHSLLVEIFLHEGDPEAAWREAEAGSCSGTLWLELAKHREKSHPADAVRIYRNHIAALLRNTGNRVYDEAVRYLERIRTVLAQSGTEAEFPPLLTEIRATHNRKRNLMKLLDQKGW